MVWQLSSLYRSRALRVAPGGALRRADDLWAAQSAVPGAEPARQREGRIRDREGNACCFFFQRASYSVLSHRTMITGGKYGYGRHTITITCC